MSDQPPSAPWTPSPGVWTASPPGPAYPGGAPSPTQSTSGLAIASLVTGLFFWCFVLPGIVAVVLGYLALERIDDSGGLQKGRGMAIAGIVLGWVGIALLGLGLLAWVINLLAA